MNSNFKELLSVFNRFRVRYLVVGAYAVMRYTEPRYTKDLDVWIEPSPGNAERVYKALVAFGAPLSAHTPQDFTERYSVFQIGVEPQRIDVLGNISGVRFSSAWAQRKTSRIESIRIHFISRKDLIKNKKASGRPQDLMDLANLKGET